MNDNRSQGISPADVPGFRPQTALPFQSPARGADDHLDVHAGNPENPEVSTFSTFGSIEWPSLDDSQDGTSPVQDVAEPAMESMMPGETTDVPPVPPVNPSELDTSFIDFPSSDADTVIDPERSDDATPGETVLLPPVTTGTDDRSANAPRGSGPSAKVIMAAGASAVVIALIAGGAWLLHERRIGDADIDARQEAAATCSAAFADYDKAYDRFSSALQDARAASSITADQVTDANTVTALKNALGKITESSQLAERQCAGTLSADTLKANTKAINQQTSTLSADTKALSAATDAVKDSKEAKDDAPIQEAKSKLSEAVSNGQTTLDNSNGAVTDESTRTALQAALDQANALLKQDKPSVDDMQTAIDAINKAIGNVYYSYNQYMAGQQSTPSTGGTYTPRRTTTPNTSTNPPAQTEEKPETEEEQETPQTSETPEDKPVTPTPDTSTPPTDPNTPDPGTGTE